MGHYWSEQIVVDVLVRAGEGPWKKRRTGIESGADQISIMAAEICFDPDALRLPSLENLGVS